MMDKEEKTYPPEFLKTLQQYLINTAHDQLSADRTIS
jgi:hypothetical protein